MGRQSCLCEVRLNRTSVREKLPAMAARPTTRLQQTIYCRKCEYILNGLPENRCPECGTEYNPLDPSSFLRARRPKWWSIRWEVPAAAGCALVVLAIIWSARRFGYSFPGVSRVIVCVFAIGFSFGFAWSASRRGTALSRSLGILQLIVYSYALFRLLTF